MGFSERNKRKLPENLQAAFLKQLNESVEARKILDKKIRSVPVDDKIEEVLRCESHLEALAAKRS